MILMIRHDMKDVRSGIYKREEVVCKLRDRSKEKERKEKREKKDR